MARILRFTVLFVVGLNSILFWGCSRRAPGRAQQVGRPIRIYIPNDNANGYSEIRETLGALPYTDHLNERRYYAYHVAVIFVGAGIVRAVNEPVDIRVWGAQITDTQHPWNWVPNVEFVSSETPWNAPGMDYVAMQGPMDFKVTKDLVRREADVNRQIQNVAIPWRYGAMGATRGDVKLYPMWFSSDFSVGSDGIRTMKNPAQVHRLFACAFVHEMCHHMIGNHCANPDCIFGPNIIPMADNIIAGDLDPGLCPACAENLRRVLGYVATPNHAIDPPLH